jgi:PIN domain nuclease of toxin-antitoxin system
VLAFLNQEPGTEQVEPVLSRAYISTVNVAEVVTHLANQGLTETEVQEVLEDLDLEIVPFDQRQSILTGLLRPVTRNLGLSLGDRACLSLAHAIRSSC